MPGVNPSKISFRAAFTMVELIVVVVISSVLIVAAIVQFNKTMEKSKYNRARMNLRLIHSAVQIYKVRHPDHPTELINTTWNISDINTNLGLNIMDSSFTYLYGGPSVGFTVQAVRDLGANAYTVSTVPEYPLYGDGSNLSCLPAGKCPGP